MGLAYVDLGDQWGAIEFYEQALLITPEIGDRQAGGIHACNLALLLDGQGEHAAAAELMRLWVDRAREVGYLDAEGRAQIVTSVRARAAGGSGPR